jgi:hypothetical protein
LKRYTGDWGKIARAANNIPGLDVETAQHEYNKVYTVCLGWDGAALRRICKDIEAAAKVEKEQEKWQEAIRRHEELVKATKKAKKGGKKASGKSADQRGELSRCVGSYVIRCDHLEPGYGSNLSTVDIQSSGPTRGILVAAVDWGTIKGTMLLSFSEEESDTYIESTDGIADAYDFTDEETRDTIIATAITTPIAPHSTTRPASAKRPPQPLSAVGLQKKPKSARAPLGVSITASRAARPERARCSIHRSRGTLISTTRILPSRARAMPCTSNLMLWRA